MLYRLSHSCPICWVFIYGVILLFCFYNLTEKQQELLLNCFSIVKYSSSKGHIQYMLLERPHHPKTIFFRSLLKHQTFLRTWRCTKLYILKVFGLPNCNWTVNHCKQFWLSHWESPSLQLPCPRCWCPLSCFLSEVRQDSIPVKHLQPRHCFLPQFRIKSYRDDGRLLQGVDDKVSPAQTGHCQLTLDLWEVTVSRLKTVNRRLGRTRRLSVIVDIRPAVRRGC